MFQQMLHEVVHDRGYSYRELVNLLHIGDQELTDEGRWLKMVCIQAALEHINAQEALA